MATTDKVITDKSSKEAFMHKSTIAVASTDCTKTIGSVVCKASVESEIKGSTKCAYLLVLSNTHMCVMVGVEEIAVLVAKVVQVPLASRWARRAHMKQRAHMNQRAHMEQSRTCHS